MSRQRISTSEITAVVTGASSGIGAAIARRLALDGARLVLVARREDRLQALAHRIGGATLAALDLTEDEAPERVRKLLEQHHEGRLQLLVNNAGASWFGPFGENGWDNVRQTMEINFDAHVRLTETLLPLLRASAPSAIVNVASVAGRIGRSGVGAYSASKFALIGWTDSLHLEEKPHGVHVGLVLPGFVATEGFPQRHLVDRRLTRWMVSTPERVAEAIVEAGPDMHAERYVPRLYWAAAVLRSGMPRILRAVLQSRIALSVGRR